MFTRKQLDDSFPTIVRYGGFILVFILVFASIFRGAGLELAAGYVAATGMILYKTVKEAASNDNGK